MGPPLCRSQWLRSLRRRSSATWLLGSRVWIPLGAWILSLVFIRCAVLCRYRALRCADHSSRGVLQHVWLCVIKKPLYRGGQGWNVGCSAMGGEGNGAHSDDWISLIWFQMIPSYYPVIILNVQIYRNTATLSCQIIFYIVNVLCLSVGLSMMMVPSWTHKSSTSTWTLQASATLDKGKQCMWRNVAALPVTLGFPVRSVSPAVWTFVPWNLFVLV
jgi:hypothetical protein